ncbi:MAG: hypothetical protein ACM3JG_00860 [Thiohalocapsa sp.]
MPAAAAAAAALTALLLPAAPAAAVEHELAAPSAAAPSAAPAERVHVEGFRSAHWGMSEAEVRAAIARDFRIPADRIKSEENLAERTHVLSVVVPDLLEGAGAGRVSYIFGYTTKKLIQVNILWGTAVDPQIAPDRVVAAADQLRQLLVDSGYEPESVISNARLSDGEVLVFKGEDAEKHTTVLRLAAASHPAGRGQAKTRKTATALALSYIFDARNPDIYRLKKGQF